MIESTTLSVDEVIDTLTGYDELAIEQRFGGEINGLLGDRPLMGMRALAFTLVARDLKSDDVKDAEGKAYRHIMGMTLKQVGDFFADAEDEPMPDEPITEQGKDDSPTD